MFEVVLSKSALIKKILDSLKDLIEEASFDCSLDGITLQAMDSSHVGLASLLLSPTAFSDYRCDKNLSIGLKISEVSKVFRCINNDDKLTLRSEDDPNSLAITADDDEKGSSSSYEISLINIDQEHLSIPEIEYDAVIIMGASKFQRICKDFLQFCDEVTIRCERKTVTFTCGGDTVKAEVKLSQTAHVDKDDTVSVDVDNPVTVNFSLKFLALFARAATLSSEVTISVSNSNPLCVEYDISGDNSGDRSVLKYFLAPKVDDLL